MRQVQGADTAMSEHLNEHLLAAHAAEDKVALVGLYRAAAGLAEMDQDIERECFFLTHAWIFALETDHPMRDNLHAKLARHGRD